MLAVAKDSYVMKAIFVGVLWNVARHVSTPFYGAYQIKEPGFSMRFISVIGIVYGIVRSLVSPFTGKYADRNSFSKLLYWCFMIAGAGFFVNIFTRPENGKVLFVIYNVFSAISMAGIISSLMNVVYDHAPVNKRTESVGLYYVLSGISGFLATYLASPVVAMIQKNGNRIFGLSVYPAQFRSAVTVCLIAALIVYVKCVVLQTENKKNG